MSGQDNSDGNSRYLSPGILKNEGWDRQEYDEFEVPFQWIGRKATFSLETDSLPGFLYIHAGSPAFAGNRTLRVTGPGVDQTMPVTAGWKAYQVRLDETLRQNGKRIRIDLEIDKLLDVSGDPRDLGLMVREVHIRGHCYQERETEVAVGQQNIALREAWYAPADAPNIVWLASYPNSGNTWMRFLLTNLLFEPIEHSSSIAGFIDEVIDPLYARSRATQREIRFRGSKPAHIMKTHLPFSYSMPMKDKTAGAIYVVRNPLDVAVSLRKFCPQDPDSVTRDFLTYGEVSFNMGWGHGGWHNHVYSWTRAAAGVGWFPLTVIRYEDLKTDTFETCQKLLDWLHIQRTPGQIRNAIERSSLTNMKRMEEKETNREESGIFYTAESRARIREGERLLARGQSQVYKSALSEEEIELGTRTFGPIMKQLGYI